MRSKADETLVIVKFVLFVDKSSISPLFSQALLENLVCFPHVFVKFTDKT